MLAAGKRVSVRYPVTYGKTCRSREKRHSDPFVSPALGQTRRRPGIGPEKLAVRIARRSQECDRSWELLDALEL